MRRNEFIKSSAVAGFSLMLAGCGKTADSLSENDVQYFRYADNQPDDYPTSQAAYHFAELVAERTGGRIQIKVYTNAQLGDETSVIEQVQYGMIDFARVSIGTLSQFAPEMNVLQMPYLYLNGEQMWRVLDGKIGDTFRASLAGCDIYGLSWFDAGSRSFYTNCRPITCLADMAGLTIRVQESNLMMDMIRALGASPVESVYKEVYSSLQSGAIDGAENNFPSYESMLHFEVAPYFSEDKHMRVPEMQVVSKATMDSLAAEDQDVIHAAAQESAIYERKLWKEREEASRQKVLEAGTIINQLSDAALLAFQQAVAPLYDQYCSDYTDIIAAIRTS